MVHFGVGVLSVGCLRRVLSMQFASQVRLFSFIKKFRFRLNFNGPNSVGS